MSDTYEFTVTIGTTDAVADREEAAELLQWIVSDANQQHESINYVTVQHSEMSPAERGRLLDLLYRPSDDDILTAIEALDALQED